MALFGVLIEILKDLEEVKRLERRNKKDRDRRKIDKKYSVTNRLRRSLNHAMNKYSKTGKIMGSKKYGINWKIFIEKLKPFPKKLKNFEIDHILPLHAFNLTRIEEVRKAFDPSNLQWLTIEENRKKGRKILKHHKHLLNRLEII